MDNKRGVHGSEGDNRFGTGDKLWITGFSRVKGLGSTMSVVAAFRNGAKIDRISVSI